jgi:hypothetical protein
MHFQEKNVVTIELICVNAMQRAILELAIDLGKP